jgi:hypothetical protein
MGIDSKSKSARDILDRVVEHSLLTGNAVFRPISFEEIHKDPNTGHCFEALGAEIGKLVDEKQAAYGNSYGKSGDILKILYPGGVKPDQYVDMLGIVRVVDKLFRIATMKDAFGESPWKDIAGYGLLGALKRGKK